MKNLSPYSKNDIVILNIDHEYVSLNYENLARSKARFIIKHVNCDGTENSNSMISYTVYDIEGHHVIVFYHDELIRIRSFGFISTKPLNHPDID